MHNHPPRGPLVDPGVKRAAGVPRRIVQGDHARRAVDGVLKRVARREAVKGGGDLRGAHLAFGGMEVSLLAPCDMKPRTFKRLDLKLGSSSVVPTGCQA